MCIKICMCEYNLQDTDSMTKDNKTEGLIQKTKKIFESEDPKISLIRDILWIAAVVGGVALFLFVSSGTWPAVVTIESSSMEPNMNIGDIVFVSEKDRYGGMSTWTESIVEGYSPYGDYPDKSGAPVYGDVIIYRRNGDEGVTPIIHRALAWLEEGETVMLTTTLGGNHISYNYTAPSSGYITKGDNNDFIDQVSVRIYDNSTGRQYGSEMISAPVKEDWVIGKALFALPLIGYLPLNIVPLAIIILLVLVVQELWLRRRE